MPNNLVQVVINHDSGLPEDRVINTFSFGTELAKDDTTAAAIVAALQSFYAPLDNFMSVNLDPNDVAVKFYDRADAAPRVPWYTGLFDLTIPGSTGLPEEVALVLSFHAAYASGSPSARRRGRVFIGPLAQSVMGAGADGHRPSGTCVEAWAEAGTNLRSASNDSEGVFSWDVWSQVDGVGRAVTGGWVDNAFDTQRRRGVAPLARTTFGIAP